MVVRVLVRISVLVLLAMLAVTLSPADASARASATGLRLGAHPDGITRLVLDLSDSIDFNTALYADPYRVVINTPAVTWDADAAIKKAYGSVRSLRYDEDSLGGRIMIELKEPATVKSAFVIPPRDGQGWRFVMDLKTTTRAVFLAAAVPVRAVAETRNVAMVDAKIEATAGVAAAAKANNGKAQIKPVPRAEALPAPTPEPPAAPPPPAMGASAPTAALAPASPPRSIVVYSPEAQPAVPPALAPSPPSAPPAPTAPVAAKFSTTVAPVMSAPVPPPLERPAVLPAMVAVTPDRASTTPAAMDSIPAATKVSAPLPVPEALGPKALPADGKPVVVIDAGHGGVDPGAIGVSGIYEKYITLAVARELKAQLVKNGRYKVFLTRDRDVFIRLRDRVAIARQYNADLFISLHADSVGNPQLKGLSVYTLSQNSSDSEAQALADKENKADLIAGIDLSHESPDVANILIDLAQRETLNRSAGFAGGVVDEVGREGNLLGNTHRFAGFAVLKAPDVPSVLVEMGYLSNEAEERNLRQPEHRAKLAKSISRAVDRFFVQGQKARRP